MMHLRMQIYWHTPLSADHTWNTHRNGVIRYICKLKRRDSVTEPLDKPDVQTLGDMRKASRRNLLLRLILQNTCIITLVLNNTLNI